MRLYVETASQSNDVLIGMFYSGQGRHGGYKVFHFSFSLERRWVVRDTGDRKRCVDEVYIRELLDREQSAFSVL